MRIESRAKNSQKYWHCPHPVRVADNVKPYRKQNKTHQRFRCQIEELRAEDGRRKEAQKDER
jgi:hypothetical protein